MMTDIVDIHLIAERLHVQVDTVNKWRHRDILPLPDYPQLANPVWDWDTIRAWADQSGRIQ